MFRICSMMRVVKTRYATIGVIVFVFGMAGIAQAAEVQPGFDLWRTPPGGAVEDFGGAVPPIPADFFFPGSAPFVGVVDFEGEPIPDFLGEPTGGADTIVARLGAPAADPVDTIDIELVALSLRSVGPIIVGGPGPPLWDVLVTTSPAAPSMGEMTIEHTVDAGV